MGALENPPIFDGSTTPPAPGQVLRVNAAGDGWEPVTIVAAALAVPQAAITAPTAPAATTAATVATANAAAPSASYVQADEATIATLANALKVELNKVIADNVSMRAALVSTQAKLNAALAELATAGVITP